MRKLFLVLLFGFGFAVQGEDNYAVQFYGDNSRGYPYYWPKSVSCIGTNESADAPWVVLSQAQLDNILATNKTAFYAAKVNYQATNNAALAANIAALVTSYSNLQWCADHFDYVTNIANVRIAIKAQGEVLLKLGPVLKSMYVQEIK